MPEKNKMVAMDANTAAAHVAHATNEVIAIYPITPSSVMGELSDLKSAKGEKNIWDTVPNVIEMQSEGGASGAVHGALTAGALTTTFTASQGLLLMIPNMYKIAGELTPTVFHVSARAVATHALSIFGDHSDVMATRQTGWALLASANPQEAMDFALISQCATLRSRIPFLHFFDGFRSSHELNMVDVLSKETMKAMLDENLIAEHKKRGLNPEHPVMRGTAQNPDVFFQGREASNKFYFNAPKILKEEMEKFEKLTGRKYGLFEYVGNPKAERVVVVMASGADICHETAEYLSKEGEKVGVIKVRLYRPWFEEDFLAVLPKTLKSLAVLDRTKEPGAAGEPLYQDVVTSVSKAFKEGKISSMPLIVGGRYGLGSKEFTPSMAKAVFDNLKSKSPKNNFTVGIKDDVTNLSLDYDNNWSIEDKDVFRALFYGLGSDGTVGANKNTIKIISEETDNYAQGYFVYDSKKAGSLTVSHVRFGKKYIRSPYLVYKARFIGCHQFSFLDKYEMVDKAEENGVFLLNSPYSASEVWDKIPAEVQKQMIDKKLKFYVINASKIAKETGMGSRINVIMQTAFFAISGVLPKEEAIKAIKNAIKKTYQKKGEEVVKKNWAAVDAAIAAIEEVKYPLSVSSKIHFEPCRIDPKMPDFVKKVTCEMTAYRGDNLPVSVFPVDGTYPTATTQYEKRNIALECPSWEPDLCIQCGICSLVCPHAAIRIKAYEASELKNPPSTFKSTDGKTDLKGLKFTVQVAVEDCTGCGACVYNCPAKERKDGKETGKKAINMKDQLSLRETEKKNWEYFMALKEKGSQIANRNTVKGSQLVRPLFEFSGACAGCGETPYVKLLTQMFGDHLSIANATGCSSIYGGNLPTTPYCLREDGKGPAWSNSLFEDNAEFGLGMRLAYDKMKEEAREKLSSIKNKLKNPSLADEILNNPQKDWTEIEKQRGRVEDLKKELSSMKGEEAKRMLTLSSYLIEKSVWILGGDGWAYDIGYGGLDHVLASGKKVRILVLDTEVYSNTGGQMSKATPLGAMALFAAGGKPLPKKDLGMISMTYGNIYVAQVALGANMQQAIKAFAEAEAYNGPAIIIAYSHCIAHGINMNEGMNEQKKAVSSGRWVLYRFNPSLRKEGKNPLTVDSQKPTTSLEDYMLGENRFRALHSSNPEVAKKMLKLAEQEYKWRLSVYQQIASMSCDVSEEKSPAAVK